LPQAETVGYNRSNRGGVMGNLLGLLLYVLQGVLNFVLVCILAWVIMSWLIVFNVINMRHPFVRQVEYFLNAITRPILRPIQKIIPTIGNVDLSPLIALLLIQGVIQYVIIPARLAVAGY
jgi:YggT family protein